MKLFQMFVLENWQFLKLLGVQIQSTIIAEQVTVLSDLVCSIKRNDFFKIKKKYILFP